MSTLLQPGTEVTVSSAHGPVRLVVVRDLGETVALVSSETFRRGCRTLRDAVGFRRTDIIEIHVCVHCNGPDNGEPCAMKQREDRERAGR